MVSSKEVTIKERSETLVVGDQLDPVGFQNESRSI